MRIRQRASKLPKKINSEKVEEGSSSRYIFSKKRKQYSEDTEGWKVKKLKEETEYREK